MRPGKTLVIGSEGFLGKGFYRAYQEIYPQILGTHYRSPDPKRNLNLYEPDLTPLQLQRGEYSYALIAAANAHPAVCEQERGLSFRRNVEGVLRLAELFIQWEITPILLSTAYVFDGIQGDYEEESPTCPINEYGRQKEAVEQGLKHVCKDNYLIIRCSKVFNLVKGSQTLIDQIGSQLLQGQIVRAAHDQIFSPIWLEDLIRAVFALQEAGLKGVYHISGEEKWSRLDLAREVGRVLGAPPHLIVPVSLEEVQSSFRMPKKTNLLSEKLRSSVKVSMQPLSSSIQRLKELYSECMV